MSPIDPPEVPVRYRFAPLVGLLLLALVPLAALTALLIWSDAQADEHEAVESSQPDRVESPTEPSPPLSTTMLAFRRAPVTLAGTGAANELAAAMDQLAVFIDPRSCLAVSVNGRPVGSWNGDVAVLPASTNKLLIAGAAVEVLGADHRFTTSVASPAAVEGVVEGDVFLVGGGDPLLVASGLPAEDDAPDPSATSTLDELADAVVGAGITSIRGAIIGDGTRYDAEFVNPTWADGVAYVDAGPI
ncbi:MAG TPA: D-alanyl-D-alanine carboxypeptidase, partial [Ilumatobacteraceae bacterium]|nr:D-alanyl-D-alanine carboxypeptidase [Ilumatobacteraceae bacterium]